MQRQQDAVGLVTFNTGVQSNLTANSHPSHLKRLVHELEQTQVDDQTDVGSVFAELANQKHQRGLVILLSDLFVDLDTLAESVKKFRHRRHEMIIFQVMV